MIPTPEIPRLVINNAVVEIVVEFSLLGTNIKWVYEFELPFIKDCEQNFSSIGHNESA